MVMLQRTTPFSKSKATGKSQGGRQFQPYLQPSLKLLGLKLKQDVPNQLRRRIGVEASSVANTVVAI